MTRWRLAAVALLLAVLLGLPGLLIRYESGKRARVQPEPVSLGVVATLGRRIFFDTSLSASGKMSCATCHSPRHAYGPPNALAAQRGGPDMRSPGLRAVPSLRYHEHTPAFSIGPTDASADNDDAPAAPPPPAAVVRGVAAPKSAAGTATAAETPQGGLDWDGRGESLQHQARGPFLDPNEMANRDSADLLEKLKKAAYAEDFRRLFGPRIFDQPDLALSEALFALTRFQIEDPSFHPYDSKYDRYLAGKAKLTPREKRGLLLFEDPKKGNCSSCHISKASPDGRFPPAFTDYEFAALGAPRNMEIAANRDPAFFDLGLCGPLRRDYASVPSYCGLFKTPTLRNAAARGAFFHNGVFHTLENVLKFYVERETRPERWYPRKAGAVDKYDDLPPRYRGNVNVVDAPFDRKAGAAPALDAAEIADILAFLGTLNDADQEINKR